MKFEKITSINLDISEQELKVLTKMYFMLKEFGEIDAFMIFDGIVRKEPVIRTRYRNATIRVRYNEDEPTIDIRSPSKVIPETTYVPYDEILADNSEKKEEKPKERNLDLRCKITKKYFSSSSTITNLHTFGFKVASDFIGHKREDIKYLKSPKGFAEATMNQIDAFLYDNGIILNDLGVYVKDKDVHKPVDISQKHGLKLSVNPDGTIDSIEEI